MKKYITLIVCAVLLLVSTLIYAPPIKDVTPGAGLSINAKVASVNQMVDAMEFAYSHIPGSSAQYTYDSATVQLKIKQTSSSYEYNDGYSYDSSYSSDNFAEQDILLCNTRNALYMRVSGRTANDSHYYYSSSSSSSNEKIQMVVVYDIEMYMDKDMQYVKYNVFDVVGSDELEDEDESYVEEYKKMITNDMLNKWFAFSSDTDSPYYESSSIRSRYLSSVIDAVGVNAFMELGDYLDSKTVSDYQKAGNVYTLLSHNMDELIREGLVGGEINTSRGNLKVDLSNDRKPVLEIVAYGERFDSEDSERVELVGSMVISNLNNTVISSGIETGLTRLYKISDYIVED